MKFKVCVIGCGAIAFSMHGPAYLRCRRENPALVFSGCCDIDEAKAENFKVQFGFESAYTNMDTMLDEQKPDAVCLISPVQFTVELAAKILDRGIPLLLEKPPGRVKEETLRLMEAAEKKNVPNMVAFNRRYSPLVRKLKERLDLSFSPEAIQSIQYDMFRINRLDEDFSTTAIHAIDAAKFIAGSDFQTIQFSYREFPALGKNVADVTMHCIMKSGTVVKINICPVTGINMERAVVNLHDHSSFLDFLGTELYPSGRLVLVYKNNITADISGDLTDGKEPFEREGFYFENKHFFDSVMAGHKPAGDLRTTLQTVEAGDCIRNRRPYFED
ncbi:MAG: Gfo/Idh/MocA family oxidoreductase [Treponema sp.]|jgi:predicted dehydrogenase|nr:Gfo/Idh/MocA family oxidoreductase [Treponema sp.]